MELSSTVDMMLSYDYMVRFKAEYCQLKIRTDKLNRYITRIQASNVNPKVDAPAHDCPLHILEDQLDFMWRYLHILEIRAHIEGIELPTTW